MKKHVMSLIILFIASFAHAMEYTPQMATDSLQNDINMLRNKLSATYPESFSFTGQEGTEIAHFKNGDSWRFKGTLASPNHKIILNNIDSFFTNLKNNNNFANKILLIRNDYTDQKVPAQQSTKALEIYNSLNAMIPGTSTKIPAKNRYEANLIATYDNPFFEFATESKTGIPGRKSGELRNVQVYFFPND